MLDMRESAYKRGEAGSYILESFNIPAHQVCEPDRLGSGVLEDVRVVARSGGAV